MLGNSREPLSIQLRGSLQPSIAQVGQQICLTDPLHPYSSAHLGVLWKEGCVASIPCQLQREQARRKKFSVQGSSRAGVSKDESYHVCKRLSKGFESNPAHCGRERVQTRTPEIDRDDSASLSTHSQHKKHHSMRAGARTQLQRAGNQGANS